MDATSWCSVGDPGGCWHAYSGRQLLCDTQVGPAQALMPAQSSPYLPCAFQPDVSKTIMTKLYVSCRDVDTGMYLSYQGESTVSLRLEPSPEQTEIWRMEDLGRNVSDANTRRVCFRGVAGNHYYLGAALAGWVTLRTHCFKWEHWSLHLQ